MIDRVVVDISGTVVNVVVCGNQIYDPGAGLTVVDNPGNVGMGWRLVNGSFIAPPNPEPEPET